MIARLSSRRQLVIPKSIANALGLKRGDLLKIQKKGNTILMTPVEIVEKRGSGKRKK